MRFAAVLTMSFLIGSNAALGASIYKCTTEEGVVFSQSPCAPDAVMLKSGGSKKPNPADAEAREPVEEAGDATIFDALGSENADVIIDRAGQPEAKYTHDGTEHWLYSNYVKTSAGARVCPELLLENGRAFQVSWIPQDIMKKSVEVGRRLADWKQPGAVGKKAFTLENTDVQGQSKSDVTAKFGQPDAKKIANGREIWEYRKVHVAEGSTDTYTIYLAFDGDTVVSSVAN